MDFPKSLLKTLLLLTLASHSVSQSIIQISPREDAVSTDLIIRQEQDNTSFCESWKFSVETNNAGKWSQVPSRCVQFVQDYMLVHRYLSDSELVAAYALEFATAAEISSDGKDAWVFDIDETLLSNLPYYETHNFGAETFNEKDFDVWADLAEAPALPASLRLYKKVEKLGFIIFLLTGRSEYSRNSTEKNLLSVGYTNWKRLILRGPSDEGKSATVYKSEKREELVNEGYRIHGNSGDQWTDLLGFATSTRSFKLPNPMYYVP